MKLIEIVNAHDAVAGLAENEQIGVHLAYVMTKFVVATQADADFYAQEMRKLFTKYGQKKENEMFVVPPENIEAFTEAAHKLQETDGDDPGIRFSLAEMSQELKLSMKQIYPMMSFIQED